jgi:hypothetical protein
MMERTEGRREEEEGTMMRMYLLQEDGMREKGLKSGIAGNRCLVGTKKLHSTNERVSSDNQVGSKWQESQSMHHKVLLLLTGSSHRQDRHKFGKETGSVLPPHHLCIRSST